MRLKLRLTVALLALAVPSGGAWAQTVAGDAAVAALPQPTDVDERGLWMQMDDAERKLKSSNFVIHDPALNAYVHDVFCRTAGQTACQTTRIYITRTPYFNASMAPNGMMQIWSGLFLRVRNEAQLAAVLGHEYVHFRERHSLRLFRNFKDKTNAIAWLSFVPFGGIVQLGLIGTLFSFSREMERDADAGSVKLIADAGYDPAAASKIWEQIRAEELATAAERKRKRRGNGGFFATHPATDERIANLKALGVSLARPGATSLETERYQAAIAPFWTDFIDDQVKLNDFGASELLIGQLGSSGWSGDLLFARGELYRARGNDGDFAAAAGFYQQAIAATGAPAETYRGLGLALLRSGQPDAGKAALKEYLKLKPGATDRAMIGMLAGDS